MSTDGDGNGKNAARLEINILSPWYNTWYAWILYLITFTGVTWLIVRYKNDKKNFSYSLEKERFEKHHIEQLYHEINRPDDNSLLEKGKKYSVLVVEDKAELLQALNNLFSPFYFVITAVNGKDGLDKANEFKPDLVVSDIMMPEMSGMEMCMKIKNNIYLCHIPIILLTALNAVEQNIEALNVGADDYISKPFNSNILLARANCLVRNRLLIYNQIRKSPIMEVNLTGMNFLDQNILIKTSEAIEAHIDDTEFDVPELCKEIGIGRSVLYSKFRDLTGMTPNNFILNYRLKYAAAMLLKYPDLLVAEVSDKCGFSSSVYFSRCFKNQYGETPQIYRKNSANGK